MAGKIQNGDEGDASVSLGKRVGSPEEHYGNGGAGEPAAKRQKQGETE